MHSGSTISTTTAPPILLQTARVRRRVPISDAVAVVLASLAFGEPRRSDLATLASLTAARVADMTGGGPEA